MNYYNAYYGNPYYGNAYGQHYGNYYNTPPMRTRLLPQMQPQQEIMTYIYNENGINVKITGSPSDIGKVEALLKINAFSQRTTNVQPQQYLPMDAPPTKNMGSQIQQQQQQQHWSYIPNSTKTSMLLAHSSTIKPFSGSGVIFVEKPINGTDPTILLLKSPTNTYEDFGGPIDKSMVESIDALKFNAFKRTYEESKNLFVVQKVDTNIFSDVNDESAVGGLYRCFFVGLNATQKHPLDQWFLNNRTLLASKVVFGANKLFGGALELTRFTISSIKAGSYLASPNTLSCYDTNNNLCVLRERTTNCLKSLIDDPQLLISVINTPTSVLFEQDKNVYSQSYGMMKLLL